MTLTQIAIQAIGVVAMVLTIGCYQLKKRKNILLAQYFGNALWCVHYFFLAAYPALVMNALNVVRGIIYASDKRWAKSNLWIAVFCALPVAAEIILLRFGLVDFDQWYSYLPIIGTIIAAVALRLKDENVLRIVYITSVPFWIVYNALAGSLPGTISAVFTLVSISVALVRYRKKRKAEPMTDKKLVIFDMDGTILDTLEDLYLCVSYTLKKCGYKPVNKETVKKYTGKGVAFLLKSCMPSSASDDEFDKAFSIFKPYYEAHCNDHTEPYGGVVDCIKEIKARGYKTAVLSNKIESAVKDLCAVYFNGLFDAVIGYRDGLRPKPYPDGIESVLTELSVARSEAVLIGDSEIDIETGRNAGIDVIGAEWGFRSRKTLVDMRVETILSKPAEISSLFPSL